MSLNVFGRTLGPGNTDGRQHNPNHQVSHHHRQAVQGRRHRRRRAGADRLRRARPSTRRPAPGHSGGDIKAVDTLAAFGQTMLASVGADPEQHHQPVVDRDGHPGRAGLTRAPPLRAPRRPARGAHSLMQPSHVDVDRRPTRCRSTTTSSVALAGLDSLAGTSNCVELHAPGATPMCWSCVRAYDHVPARPVRDADQRVVRRLLHVVAVGAPLREPVQLRAREVYVVPACELLEPAAVVDLRLPTRARARRSACRSPRRS